MNVRRLALAALGAAFLLLGCGRLSSKPQVVVYAALDAEFSQPVLARFQDDTGIYVASKFDVESTKTVGLTQAIISEAARPRCDVFWNNEILNTLRLEQRGLLEAYQSPAAASFPELFRSPEGTWHGFAARARILIVNADVPESERPDSIFDLLDPKWKGRIGIAKPLFGTTATHAACLFATLGDRKAKEFFRKLKANGVLVMSGNKQVAQAAGAGQIAFGLTDTDDAIGELEQGRRVAIVYPDRRPDQLGTLFIPNTLAIVKGCPHPEAARRLVDYLLQPNVEARLAAGPSAQIPLNPVVETQLETEVRVETPRTVKAMPVDFRAASRQWDRTAEFIKKEFTGAD